MYDFSATLSSANVLVTLLVSHVIAQSLWTRWWEHMHSRYNFVQFGYTRFGEFCLQEHGLNSSMRFVCYNVLFWFGKWEIYLPKFVAIVYSSEHHIHLDDTVRLSELCKVPSYFVCIIIYLWLIPVRKIYRKFTCTESEWSCVATCRVFVGTVSEFCVKHAECPVITIKRNATEAPQDPVDDWCFHSSHVTGEWDILHCL